MIGINHKNIWHDRDSKPEPTAWESCCPKPTAVFHFWIKRVGDFGLKKKLKKKIDLTEWIIFVAYYICCEKWKKKHCWEINKKQTPHMKILSTIEKPCGLKIKRRPISDSLEGIHLKTRRKKVDKRRQRKAFDSEKLRRRNIPPGYHSQGKLP